MSIKHRVFVYLVLILGLIAVASGMKAQNVVQHGKTFVQQVDSSKKVVKEPTLTGYNYIDSKGVAYPIYLSSTGKAFIKRTSKRTGKEYRQYLPEVTKKLNSNVGKT